MCVYTKYKTEQNISQVPPSLFRRGEIQLFSFYSMNDVSFQLPERRQHRAPSLEIHSSREELEEDRIPTLYFDILPENPIETILRFISLYPRAKKWARGINLEDISGLYNVRGELGSFLLTRFTAIRIISDDNWCRDTYEEAILCRVKSLLDLSLPDRFGESFHTLISEVSGETSEITAKLVAFISARFPHIRSLDMRRNWNGDYIWIENLGSSIETIRSDRYDYERIAKYCPRLKHLYLYRMTWPVDCKVNLWEKACENLETLSVLDLSLEVNAVEAVEKYCRKIKHLELRGSYDGIQDAISKCVASYGSQLQSVRLGLSFSEIYLLRVKSACPKTRVSLITSDLGLAKATKIFGSEFEEAVVYVQMSEHIPVDWSTCTNIEKVECLGNFSSEADIRCLLNSPKSHLRSLQVETLCELKHATRIVTLIARGTGALEDFFFGCGDAPPVGTFNELADSNKSLRWVKIGFYNQVDNEILIDLVKTFVKAPLLEILEVNVHGHGIGNAEPIPDVEKICRTLRSRYVRISVRGFRYLR